MFVVCFVRADGSPNEKYYYNSLKDAQFHFDLFEEDDSKLYQSISLVDGDGKVIKLQLGDCDF